MTLALAKTLPELEARLESLRSERYGIAETVAEAQVLAEKVGDCEYLMARIRCLEARAAQHAIDVAWTSPADRSAPAETLLRIKALCAQFPELFNALSVVAATHPGVPRDRLALAIKQFRRDADALSKDDVVSLLVGIGTGAREAFEAVMRTRKAGERRAGMKSMSWINRDEI